MRLRRTVGVLVTFAMAHLAAVGGDVACARHAVDQAAQSAGLMPGMDHGHKTGHSDHPGDTEPCKSPARADCCQAVTACAAFVSIAHRASTTVPVCVDDVPLSRVAAPDPPPPKA